jgi:predicted phage terminase large subunit-like protein
MTEEEMFVKMKCEGDFLFFVRYMFYHMYGRKFTVSPFHVKIANALMRVYNGDCKRLIINIPPRFGKTELSVKMFIAWCLARNPQSKFIHLSYSSELALDNSSLTKEYIQSKEFQDLWPMMIKRDADSKAKWFNDQNGGVYATAAGGAITGFGAGVKDSEEFAGAIIIDDPIKVDDANSSIIRNSINVRYNTTIRSRVNDRNTPIILIMQRIHEDDLSGFLLNGGSGEEWEHLCLPAINEDGTALYPEMMNLEELELLRQADRSTFAGQYLQQPAPEEGQEWRRAWFKIVNKNEIPNNIRWTIFIDGAYTKDSANDPTGIQVSAKIGNDLVIYQSIDRYMELPELIKFIPNYIISNNLNVGMIYVEPKASGKSIVQLLQQNSILNVAEISGKMLTMSKIERARLVSNYIEGGRVILVEGSWNEAYLQQVTMFPNSKHDEHIDLSCYSIDKHLMQQLKLEVR